MEKELEKIATDHNSFFVSGSAEKVADKVASLYTGPSTGGTGQKTPLDLEKIDVEALKSLGIKKEDIDGIYTINNLHRNKMAAGIIMALLGQQTAWQATVISYISRPGISEIIPTYGEGSLVCKENMTKVGLELVV